MNYLKTILISVLTTIILGLVVYYFVPLWEIDRFIRENLLGATVTEISGSDTMSNFPTVYNANLSSMNSAKAEVSTTTLNNVTSIPNLATIGTITTGTWTSTDIGVAYGGTGASTLGSNLVLLGNGTSAIQSVTAGSNDQVLTLVAGVPAWQSGTLDKTLDYAWTGQHRWTTGTTTFNSASDFNSTVSLDGYTSVASLQIASSSSNQWATASTSLTTKGYTDYEIENTAYNLSASANLKASADDEVSKSNDTNLTKVKEIRINRSGIIRIDFDLKTSADGGHNVHGRVYINGVVVGIDNDEIGDTYVTQATEDFTVQTGDLVQLYIGVNVETGYARNFRIYYDANKEENYTIITN